MTDLNYVLGAALALLALVLLRLVWPRIASWLIAGLGEDRWYFFEHLVAEAYAAADEARKSGRLDDVLDTLGVDLPVDLQDDEKVKAFVFAWVQTRLDKTWWGNKINPADIYVSYLSVSRSLSKS